MSVNNNKVIISHDDVKRELAFPFDLCLSRSALGHLSDTLRKTYNDWKEEGVTYGWVQVTTLDAFAPPCVNTPPIPWKGPGQPGVRLP